MGMFDTVTFRYRMPDGETGPDYQTIELDCGCDGYQISADGAECADLQRIPADGAPGFSENWPASWPPLAGDGRMQRQNKEEI